MSIITDECLACASLSMCGTEITKGSSRCLIKRAQNGQTKAEMLLNLIQIAEMLNRPHQSPKRRGGEEVEKHPHN